MDREEIIGVICDLYEELEISELGFDLKEICKKLEINLIPYSSYEKKDIFLQFDEDGFNIINSLSNKIEIYYNDEIEPFQRIYFTIPHEIGHIVLNHNTEYGNETRKQNKEANIFALEFYCPLCLIIHNKLNTKSDLISTFGITSGYAEVILDKLNKRFKTLSLNEKRLVEIFEKNKLNKTK
jgi:Zn-dependent peptidase ImmA (M78 family)